MLLKKMLKLFSNFDKKSLLMLLQVMKHGFSEKLEIKFEQ